MRLRSAFWWTFGASLAPMYFMVAYAQRHGSFDSIGAWYTVYSAVAFSVVLAFAVVGLIAIVGVVRKSDASDPGTER